VAGFRHRCGEKASGADGRLRLWLFCGVYCGSVEGFEGQDRESYSDEQDRESYSFRVKETAMFDRIDDPVAYEEGREEWERCRGNPALAYNPYPRLTGSWRSWNLGWNSLLQNSA